MTFAATAEVVRYMNAVPILVDCDPLTLNIDFADAERKLTRAQRGELARIGVVDVVGMIPVHVGGAMVDLDAVREFSSAHDLWVVEDAAHAFPAAWRPSGGDAWIPCGSNSSSITCFSFYANKTITTGEGGMAVTSSRSLADRMRLMSLHGLSRDAWNRYSESGSWDYQIVAPGFKYNLTDICAALGFHQVHRAEAMRKARESIAQNYSDRFRSIAEIDIPAAPSNRLHAWHLYPIRLRLERLTIGRNKFIQALQKAGVGCSVHWRPLHLHPYYCSTFGWTPEDLPVASQEWERLISLPIYPSMTRDEQDHVVQTVASICSEHRV
jgi:dTDP-4-amino-4,6-dideoxygalactose transaminase